MPRRTAAFLLSVPAAAAVLLTGAGGAGADDGHGGRAPQKPPYSAPPVLPGGAAPAKAPCAFSAAGKTWTPAQGIASLTPSAQGRISIDVHGKGGTCTVALASYRAHGATFATSGLQQITDFATVTVADGRTATLDVAVPAAGCFTQIDLYTGSTRYDGATGPDHGPAPQGPNGIVIGDRMIASWNGPEDGKDCLTVPASPAPGAGASTPAPADTPSSSAPVTAPAPAPSAGASTSAPADAPTTPPSSASASVPAPGGDSHLASTGSSGTGTLAATGAVLLLGGAGAVFAVRRRNTARHR
ncbi:LPXTG cell wall anchor domain-containing protein [Kitasatospora sp. NPDC001540]|uniref:LPXTG cell wall anchor domain-containing protein n=1 Tax=Kitasatospora sp. NPDC001540 TaxID=3364014 RepID=UPI0036A19A3A